ncbi:MAG: DUF1330 domain-containing protein [Myxococcota bacterium]
MRVDGQRFAILVGVEVQDHEGYARYRAEMTPILGEYSGRFEYDMIVSDVLKSPVSARFNRVFTISFPSQDDRVRFFSDDRYKAVRAQHFEPAVSDVVTMAEFASG